MAQRKHPMSPSELVEELESLARQFDDAVLVAQAIMDKFQPMYQAARDLNTEVGYARSLELYNNVYGRRGEVNSMTHDAKTFRQAATLIRQGITEENSSL